MKKITAFALIFFSGIVVALLGYGLMFSANNDSARAGVSPMAQKNSALNKKSNGALAGLGKLEHRRG